MVKDCYIPKSGDIVWITFEPTLGHEQSGRRPAVVLSPQTYNERSELALICPVTSKAKGYPFEVKIKSAQVAGVVLSDHVRSMAWKERQAEYITVLPDDDFRRIKNKLSALINV